MGDAIVEYAALKKAGHVADFAEVEGQGDAGQVVAEAGAKPVKGKGKPKAIPSLAWPKSKKALQMLYREISKMTQAISLSKAKSKVGKNTGKRFSLAPYICVFEDFSLTIKQSRGGRSAVYVRAFLCVRQFN